MAEQSTPSKAQLIETLRSTAANTAARLRSLPAETFEQGRYENGWNGRQILAHIASIEWTYPRLFDLAPEASTPRPAAPCRPAGRDCRPGHAGRDQRLQRTPGREAGRRHRHRAHRRVRDEPRRH